jgi:hypothetical protein
MIPLVLRRPRPHQVHLLDCPVHQQTAQSLLCPLIPRYLCLQSEKFYVRGRSNGLIAPKKDVELLVMEAGMMFVTFENCDARMLCCRLCKVRVSPCLSVESLRLTIAGSVSCDGRVRTGSKVSRTGWSWFQSPASGPILILAEEQHKEVNKDVESDTEQRY